jgi:ribonuclease Y
MAGELNLDVQLAKRSGLLHDIGKGSVVEGEGAHALVGAELARKFGESEKCVNAIASHHNDKEQESFEAVLVQVADAISASRPGAAGSPLTPISSALTTWRPSPPASRGWTNATPYRPA